MNHWVVVGVAIVILLGTPLFFFLVPVLFWTNYGAAAGTFAKLPVFRSLSCSIVGFGSSTLAGEYFWTCYPPKPE